MDYGQPRQSASHSLPHTYTDYVDYIVYGPSTKIFIMSTFAHLSVLHDTNAKRKLQKSQKGHESLFCKDARFVERLHCSSTVLVLCGPQITKFSRPAEAGWLVGWHLAIKTGSPRKLPERCLHWRWCPVASLATSRCSLCM